MTYPETLLTMPVTRLSVDIRHLVPRSKNAWSYTSSPSTPSWHGAQLKKSQGWYMR